jgi:aspartyl-tRNA(Asn)/glutamyl-tRNA(Gln) amidotransferase subunit B
MQEGSLRCDANVNLHITLDDGATVATPIVEIKNLNSFRAVEKALHYEAQRQLKAYQETGKTIKDAPKTTRGWSDVDEATFPQREKETAADYRYFPEPDLVPVVVDDAWVERLRASIGELPADRRRRFESDLGLTPYDANVLVEQGQEVADYFEEVARAAGDAKLAANWVTQDVLRLVKDTGGTLADFPIRPDVLANLLARVRDRQINTNQGREVLAAMIEHGRTDADAIIAERGFGMVSDRQAIADAVKSVLDANPKALDDLRDGKKKPDAVKGWLRGQVMKATGGKADPSLVVELVEAKLAEVTGS